MKPWEAPPEPVAEPHVGFRRWNISRGTLLSLNGTPWPASRMLVAECNRHFAPQDRGMLLVPGPHKPPGLGREVGGCDCGVWAYNYLPDPYNVWPHYDSYGRRNVYGAVYLSGRVVVCERGYRAQRAQVKYLIGAGRGVAPDIHDSLALLARRYGVPLEPPPTLPEGAARVRFRMQ